MADNVQIVDHILKEEGPGQYSVYFKELTNTDKTSIQDWLKDNIHYEDVQGAPELPVDNKAYDGNNIKPFDKIAFTADYDDLTNAPTIPEVGGERPTAFNPIAFTGVVNLDNVAVSSVINLNEYSINSSNTEYLVGMTENDIANNNTQLQNIGSTDAFVKGLNAFQKNGTGVLLFNTLQSKIISGGFLITKTPTYLVSNSGIYFLTNVKNISWNGPTLQYFELHLVAITESNYSTIRTYENNISDETATEVLENIELTGKNVILIFDFNNNILYCKTKEIWKEEEPESEPEQWITEETDPIFTASPAFNITSADINTWNNYNYNNLPDAPTLPIDTNNNSNAYYEVNGIRRIKPLQVVAFTNDYSDLSNKPIYFDYINVNGGEEEFYNIPLFGRPGSSFIDDSDLGLRIYNSFLDNKTVIIISYYGKWLITNCSTDTDETTGEISAIHYSTINILDNYNTIIDEGLPSQNENEPDLDYEERCDQVILNSLNHLISYGVLIYNIEKQKLYCKFSSLE